MLEGLLEQYIAELRCPSQATGLNNHQHQQPQQCGSISSDESQTCGVCLDAAPTAMINPCEHNMCGEHHGWVLLVTVSALILVGEPASTLKPVRPAGFAYWPSHVQLAFSSRISACLPHIMVKVMLFCYFTMYPHCPAVPCCVVRACS